MALNPLTLNVNSGIIGRPFSATISGLSAGSTVTALSRDGNQGFYVVGNQVFNPALPFAMNFLNLRETLAGTGTLDSHIAIPADGIALGVSGLPAALAALGVAQQPQTVTASALLVPNDPSKFYLMNSASAQTVTIPAGLTAWTPGMTLNLPQIGAGLVTVAVSGGATINGTTASHAGKGQYSIPQLLNIGTDAWMVVGGLN